MTRDPSTDQPGDDPDNFVVLTKDAKGISVKADVFANIFAFIEPHLGEVDDLIFCTHGNLSKRWVWNGEGWSWEPGLFSRLG